MAFEVVVRPVVFPNIRPAPAQPVFADDPTQGFATIRGNGGKQIDLSSSYSANTTTGVTKEIKRQVDEARVYQKDDDGTINRENFVDIKVAKKIWMNKGTKPGVKNKNLPEGVPSKDDSTMRQETKLYKYKPIKEEDNIEIRKRSVIERNDAAGEGAE